MKSRRDHNQPNWAPSGISAHVDQFGLENLPSETLWPDMDYASHERLKNYPDRLNAAETLLQAQLEQGRGHEIALIFGEQRWSYRALDAWSNQIANVLVSDFGLVPGNRVLLRSGNHPVLAASWYAVLKAGGIAIATMPVLRERELSHIIEKARVQFAISQASLAEDLHLASQDVEFFRETLTFGQPGNAEGLEARAAAADTAFPVVDTAASDIAVLGFTSGSTGTPKATVHFHRDLLAAADCFIGDVVKIRPGDIVCGTPQIAFLYGLCAYLVDAPRFGATSLLLERPTPTSVLAAIEAHRATVCFSTPSGYTMMLAEAEHFDLGSLRVCVAGGEPLAPATFAKWKALTGVEIINGLGISELLHIFISASGEDIRPGSIGKAVPGFEVRVVDDDFVDVAPGEVGQMIVKGPNGCRYLDDEDRQRGYINNGWNLSGDLCRLEADGYISYAARTDDMILTAGYNVAGPEVESVLLEHPAVLECAVVGSPDPARGQIVKAFVILNDSATPSPQLVSELQDFTKGRIAAFKYPRAIQFVSALPRTPTGKIRRGALREAEMGQPEPRSSPR